MGAERLAGFAAVAMDDVEHAGGIPASSASSPKRETLSGDSSLIFSTAVLPNARHGASFQVAVMNGTFQGEISAQTPTGWNRV